MNNRRPMVVVFLLMLTIAAIPLLAGQDPNRPARTGELIGLNTPISPAQRMAGSSGMKFLSVEGTKIGRFKGSATQRGMEDKIPVLRFDYEIKSPRDVATGQASGKRQHNPIRFVKEWDASTPQFFQALVTNEVIKSATFEFFKNNSRTGQSELYHVIKLTNGNISGIRQFTGDAGTSLLSAKAASSEVGEYEEISFTFQKIEIENRPGKTMALDDWMAGSAK